MSRFTDDLDIRPTLTPTPEEVEQIIARAHAMRSEAIASIFSDIRRTLADVIQPAGRHRNA